MKNDIKKGTLRIIFSRTMIIVLLLIVEFFFLFYYLRIFGDHISTAFGSTRIISLIMSIYIINNREDMSVKITWIILEMILPIFTTLLYWYIYFDIGHFLVKKKLLILEKKYTSKLLLKENLLLNQDKEINNIFNLINRVNGEIAYNNTNIEYFKLGEEAFEKIKEKLLEAKSFIFMEYFIIDFGIMWSEILEILIKKIGEGVEVRLLYDGTCSISLLPFNFPEKLEKLGIKTKIFFPIKPFLSTHYNNRDHRKILVIDGKYGFTGGINIADEYINSITRFGHWKDNAILLEGDAVKSLTKMFLTNWNINQKEENIEKYLINDFEIINNSIVIPYSESPFNNELLAEKIYIDVINNAKEYVYIFSPYFVTDDKVLSSLKLAANKGVDVRIVLPHIPDKKLVWYVAKTYYGELIDEGVKIYEYKPGFIHAKTFISDDIKAIVGTINLDYRSLYHHFELGVYIYKDKVIKNIKEDFIDTFEKSILINKEIIRQQNFITKILGRILRFFGPLI